VAYTSTRYLPTGNPLSAGIANFPASMTAPLEVRPLSKGWKLIVPLATGEPSKFTVPVIAFRPAELPVQPIHKPTLIKRRQERANKRLSIASPSCGSSTQFQNAAA
jgi:hypothetical protein